MKNKSDKKIKIGVVIPKYGLVGGGEQFAMELSQRVAENSSYEVHVLANKWKKHSDNIFFHKIPYIAFPKLFGPLVFAFFANKKAKQLGIDIVHAHERIFNCHVFTIHGIPHKTWIKKVRKKKLPSLFDIATIRLEKNIAQKAKIFFPVSEITKKEFLKEYDVDEQKIVVLHPGVDPFRFKRKKDIRDKIRKKYGLRPSDIAIVFVAMNFKVKGLGQIIRAVSKIKSKAPHIKILVAGKGNEKKYKNLAKNEGMENRLIFTGLWENKIENLYGAGDIFAMLSDFDTFGMAVLEAMSSSLPVIISKNVGAKDIVEQGINGFVVDKNNIDETGFCIIKMCDHKTMNFMAQKARETALENTWDIAGQKVMQIYEKIIKNRTEDF